MVAGPLPELVTDPAAADVQARHSMAAAGSATRRTTLPDRSPQVIAATLLANPAAFNRARESANSLTWSGSRSRVCGVTKRSRPHLLIVFACLVALAGFAAACGSSSSSNNTTNTTSGTTSGGGTTSTSGPISTSSGGGVSDSTFCSAAKKWAQNNAKETSALTSAANGGNIKTFYQTLAKEYQQIVSAAPSEIKPDLNVLVGVFNKFYVVLQKNNFDIQKAAPSLAGLAASFNSVQVKQAEAHLQAWAKANNCNFKS